MSGDNGVPLARLFAFAYRQLIDQLHDRLHNRGWRDVRPAYGFALLAARDAGTTVMELAALMGMTKQAASKLATSMVDAGFLVQGVGDDARVRPLRLTARGKRLVASVEEIYSELESEWATVIGDRALEQVRRNVTRAIQAAHGGSLPAIRPPW